MSELLHCWPILVASRKNLARLQFVQFHIVWRVSLSCSQLLFESHIDIGLYSIDLISPLQQGSNSDRCVSRVTSLQANFSHKQEGFISLLTPHAPCLAAISYFTLKNGKVWLVQQ